MWWLIIVSALVLLFYFKIIKIYKHWEDKGIPYIKPWPLLGNMGKIVFQRQSMAERVEEMYKTYPEERYVGFYQFLAPTLLIRDPDLVKQLAVKDFDVFPQHQAFAPEGLDPIWDRNLFAMKGGEKWHDMRATLSPSFTSSKMRAMFVLMKEISKQFINYYDKQEGTVTVEMNDAFRKYANDVIGSAALGITCNSFDNPTNEIFVKGKEITDFTGIRALIIFLCNISPGLMRIFRITLIKKHLTDFLRKLTKDAVSIREQQGIVRPDMIHLLMEARKGRLKHEENSNVIDSGFAVVEESELGKSQKRPKIEITDDDIAAQAFIFFFAGFDTSSILMSFASYELALNQDVQLKLTQEVDETMKKCKGDITYEALLGMKYLDLVITETLRKWSPAEFIDRVCVKNYTIEPKKPGEKPLHLDAGTNIWIPACALQKDPKFYPNPNRFDPERFSDENKHNIKPFTYMPFGVGPRSCIGSRFGLLESKLIICEILNKFHIVPVEKTQIPLRLKKGAIGMQAEKGFWVGLKPRKILTF